jgi:hypothetical protein
LIIATLFAYRLTCSHNTPGQNDAVVVAGMEPADSDPDCPRLTHVVVPFHAKQIDRLEEFFSLWEEYPPCVERASDLSDYAQGYTARLGHNVGLTLFIGSMTDTKDAEARAVYFYNKLPVEARKCFASMNTVPHVFDKTDNSYLLGAKAMFERFLNADLNFSSTPYYVFYMEPDVRPVRPGWLSFVDAQTRWPSPPFWIKGSQFRSPPKERHKRNIVTKLHINGNAIYNLRDGQFRRYYYETILPFLKRAGHKPWELAYDLFFMTSVLENFEDYEGYQRHLHKFVLSDFVQNRWHANYTVEEILKDSNSTYLVHGGNQVK